MDKYGSLYVSDTEKHEVRQGERGENNGILVAGGNGQGDSLKQLSRPTSIIVDRFGEIYINDNLNYRVMKWIKGGNGQGNKSNQFRFGEDLSFDQQGNLYVSDYFNHRIQKS